MAIFDALPFLTGELPATLPPLGRFLPPVAAGPISSWLGETAPAGAWVLDPFGASPALAVEAARAGHRVLIAANNPVARFLIEMAAAPPQIRDLQAALAALGLSRKENERLENHIQSLYLTECTNCRKSIQVEAFIWDKKADLLVGRIYTCPHCGDSGEREATPADLEHAAKWSSTAPMHRARALERVATRDDPDRVHAEEALDNYSPRAVYALGTLINRLDQLELTPARRRALEALLLYACDMGNSLWPHPTERPRPRQLNIPSRFRENNVWWALEEGMQAWSGSEEQREPIEVTLWPNLPTGPSGICIFEGALRDLASDLKTVPVSAVAAALPRPNQAFWTLSALWAGWLWGRDAVGPFRVVLHRRRYDWQWHAEALRAAFESLARGLAADLPFFALLAEPEPSFVSAALLAAQSGGFKLLGLAMRSTEDPLQLSWRTTGAESGAAAFDKGLVRDTLLAYLQARGEPATYLHLHVAGAASLAAKGALVWTSESLNEMDETVQKALDHSSFVRYEARSGPETGYWGAAQEIVAPLVDRVEMAVVEFVQHNPGCSLQAVESELCRQFPGLLTPSLGLVRAVLESYAIDDGGWHLRDEDRPQARRFDLQAIAGLLEIVAARLEYTVEKPAETQVLWMQAEDVIQAFHLSASSVIGRIARENAHPPQRTVLVIPGGRASLLAYKLRRDPSLRRQTEGWRFLKFRHLRQIAELPLLSRETWEEQLNADPIEQSGRQMMMF